MAKFRVARRSLAVAATLGVVLGLETSAAGSASALGFIFNQAATPATVVHSGAHAAAVARYQIDTTNTFSVGDTIYIKIEGVAQPSVTGGAIAFSSLPTLSLTGPTTGAFGAGVAGDTAHDAPPSFSATLASSAGAASVLSVKDELIITITTSSSGNASDHFTFTVNNPAINVGAGVMPGAVNLRPYTGDGVGPLASAITVATVSGAAVNRLAGADRIGTAIAVSSAAFPTAHSAGAVVLARSDDYPDALVGATLASTRLAPLLFASGPELSPAAQIEIQRVIPAGGTVYILGGEAAVPTSVSTTLTALGYVVTRYAGADRFGTALAVADALGDPTTVLLATGTNFPDALAAGPAAAHVHGVVLLTSGTTVPAGVSQYLLAHPGKVYAVGGPAATADPSATALLGRDRYTTAIAVATQLFVAPTAVGVASGSTFADALAGGAFIARAGGPLVLNDPSVISLPTFNYLEANRATVVTTTLFGGIAALSADVESTVNVAMDH